MGAAVVIGLVALVFATPQAASAATLTASVTPDTNLPSPTSVTVTWSDAPFPNVIITECSAPALPGSQAPIHCNTAGQFLGFGAGTSGTRTMTVTSGPMGSAGDMCTTCYLTINSFDLTNPAVGGQQVNLPITFQVVTYPPDADDDSASVNGGASVNIDVTANDTDADGDLDPATVAVVTGPTAGTATPNPDGTVTYANTNSSATSDSFTYTVDDEAGNTSNTATVSIDVLAATLQQTIEVTITGGQLSMTQAGTLVTLSSVALNGQPQVATGDLQTVTVTNSRGTDAGWTLTGQVSDFTDGTGATCPASHCIPGDDLGWAPSSSVAHVQVPGDVADVDSGSPVSVSTSMTSPPSPSLGDTANTLCSATPLHSGGTFTCGADLSLVVPASAAAGTYHATLTLTLA